MHQFPLRDGLIYLNHAAVGVWPRRTAEVVRAFADENMRQGAADYPVWMKTERELRGRLARLVNAAGTDDIALLKNTSEGLSLIAYGLEWQAGDNIVSTDQEFPSNRIVWESLQDRGVELRNAAITGDDPEGSIIALMDEKTRLLTVSSVQFGTGLRLDLERLGEACRARGVLFCVDAIQSLGALQFDAQAIHADFVVADGHKWMLGPEGLALFYSTPAARDTLRLTQYGWHMVELYGDFDRADWTPAASARRFEPGSPNMPGIYALNASLSVLEEEGMAQVEQQVQALAGTAMEVVRSNPQLELLTPADPGRHGGIVTFRCRGLDREDHQVLWRYLMENDVICAARGGGIRFSPHFYNREEDIVAAFDILCRWLREGL